MSRRRDRLHEETVGVGIHGGGLAIHGKPEGGICFWLGVFTSDDNSQFQRGYSQLETVPLLGDGRNPLGFPIGDKQNISRKQDIGVLASDSPVSVDAAFLGFADVKAFNESAQVDCMVQVQEAKNLGIRGDLKPEVISIT